MSWATASLAILYYIGYPLIFLVNGLVSLLGILLTPFVHLGSYLLHLGLLPFRILAKFEALYVFFGIASLIGVTAGLVLHFSSKFVVRVLQLSSEEPSRLPVRPRKQSRRSEDLMDAAGLLLWSKPSYKAKDPWSSGHPEGGGASGSSTASSSKMSGNYYTEWTKGRRGRNDGGLFSTTILEEEDDHPDSEDF